MKKQKRQYRSSRCSHVFTPFEVGFDYVGRRVEFFCPLCQKCIKSVKLPKGMDFKM